MSETAAEQKPYQPGERTIGEIMADLKKPIHQSFLKSRKQGGATITYIEWHTAVKYLDKFAPGWDYEIRDVKQIGDRCVCVARITIHASDGSFYREATGQEDEDKKGYGDASSNAEAMSLKRAAAKFGLGLYLYAK